MSQLSHGHININWPSFHQRKKENTEKLCEKYASSSLYEIHPNIVEDKQGQQVTIVLDYNTLINKYS